ncbi:hypothetical protein X777_05352 [Ooceraea biroi]|uniref:Chromo domain-containing protein n=1 Tax=Ooceraea biroi TaxID=2015173 RepID=A0A026WGE0_OOCBI|nr:hypothetical protein X777_05352 [Ooceraea biroi]
MEIEESEEEIHDREKIAKQIAKTSEAIRRKYRVLKTSRMEEDVALEKYFRPVVEPLKKLVENTADSFVRVKDEPTNFTRAESYTHPTRRDGNDDDSEIPRKRKHSSLDKKHPTRRDGDDDDSEILWKRKCSSTDYDRVMDKACGVYLGNEGMMLGCKRIEDMQTYKEILLATNAYKVNYKAENRVRGSKGRKYKDIIAPLIYDGKKKTGEKFKTLFEKGYTPNWTTEVFRIVEVQQTNPVTYLLKDYRGKPVAGGFYEHELHHVADPDVYLVEKVLRRRGDEVYVKWLGFDGSHNSWIHKDNASLIHLFLSSQT